MIIAPSWTRAQLIVEPLRPRSLFQVVPSRLLALFIIAPLWLRAQLIAVPSMLRSLFHSHLPLRHHAIILITTTYCSSLCHCTHLNCCTNARSSSSLQLHTHRNVFPYSGTLFGNRKLFPYFRGHYPLTISRSLISHSFFLLSTSCSANKSALASSSLRQSSTHLHCCADCVLILIVGRGGTHLYCRACCVPILIVASMERPSLLPRLLHTHLHCRTVKVAGSVYCCTVKAPSTFYCHTIKVARSVYCCAVVVVRQFIVAPSQSCTQFIVTPSRLRAQFFVVPLRLCTSLLPRHHGRAHSLSSRH